MSNSNDLFQQLLEREIASGNAFGAEGAPPAQEDDDGDVPMTLEAKLRSRHFPTRKSAYVALVSDPSQIDWSLDLVNRVVSTETHPQLLSHLITLLTAPSTPLLRLLLSTDVASLPPLFASLSQLLKHPKHYAALLPLYIRLLHRSGFNHAIQHSLLPCLSTCRNVRIREGLVRLLIDFVRFFGIMCLSEECFVGILGLLEKTNSSSTSSVLRGLVADFGKWVGKCLSGAERSNSGVRNSLGLKFPAVFGGVGSDSDSSEMDPYVPPGYVFEDNGSRITCDSLSQLLSFENFRKKKIRSWTLVGKSGVFRCLASGSGSGKGAIRTKAKKDAVGALIISLRRIRGEGPGEVGGDGGDESSVMQVDTGEEFDELTPEQVVKLVGLLGGEIERAKNVSLMLQCVVAVGYLPREHLGSLTKLIVTILSRFREKLPKFVSEGIHEVLAKLRPILTPSLFRASTQTLLTKKSRANPGLLVHFFGFCGSLSECRLVSSRVARVLLKCANECGLNHSNPAVREAAMRTMGRCCCVCPGLWDQISNAGSGGGGIGGLKLQKIEGFMGQMRESVRADLDSAAAEKRPPQPPPNVRPTLPIAVPIPDIVPPRRQPRPPPSIAASIDDGDRMDVDIDPAPLPPLSGQREGEEEEEEEDVIITALHEGNYRVLLMSRVKVAFDTRERLAEVLHLTLDRILAASAFPDQVCLFQFLERLLPANVELPIHRSMVHAFLTRLLFPNLQSSNGKLRQLAKKILEMLFLKNGLLKHILPITVDFLSTCASSRAQLILIGLFRRHFQNPDLFEKSMVTEDLVHACAGLSRSKKPKIRKCAIAALRILANGKNGNRPVVMKRLQSGGVEAYGENVLRVFEIPFVKTEDGVRRQSPSSRDQGHGQHQVMEEETSSEIPSPLSLSIPVDEPGIQIPDELPQDRAQAHLPSAPSSAMPPPARPARQPETAARRRVRFENGPVRPRPPTTSSISTSRPPKPRNRNRNRNRPRNGDRNRRLFCSDEMFEAVSSGFESGGEPSTSTDHDQGVELSEFHTSLQDTIRSILALELSGSDESMKDHVDQLKVLLGKLSLLSTVPPNAPVLPYDIFKDLILALITKVFGARIRIRRSPPLDLDLLALLTTRIFRARCLNQYLKKDALRAILECLFAVYNTISAPEEVKLLDEVFYEIMKYCERTLLLQSLFMLLNHPERLKDTQCVRMISKAVMTILTNFVVHPEELKYDLILLEIESFLVAFPPKDIRGGAPSTAHQLCKTVLAQFCKWRGRDLLDCCTLLDHENSLIVGFLRTITRRCELEKELQTILDSLFVPDGLTEGLEGLYAFTKTNPDFEIGNRLGGFSDVFRNFVQLKLDRRRRMSIFPAVQDSAQDEVGSMRKKIDDLSEDVAK